MNECSIVGFFKFKFFSDVIVIFIIIIKLLLLVVEYCVLIYFWLCFVFECIFFLRNLILVLKYG